MAATVNNASGIQGDEADNSVVKSEYVGTTSNIGNLGQQTNSGEYEKFMPQS